MKHFPVAILTFLLPIKSKILVAAQGSCGAYSNDQGIKFKNLLDENARATNENLFGSSNDTTPLVIELASNFTGIGIYQGSNLFTGQNVVVNITVTETISQDYGTTGSLVKGTIITTRASVTFIGPVAQTGSGCAWYLVPDSSSTWAAAGVDDSVLSTSALSSRSLQVTADQCRKNCMLRAAADQIGCTTALLLCMFFSGGVATPACVAAFLTCKVVAFAKLALCFSLCPPKPAPAPAPKPVIKPAPAPKPVIKPAPAPKPIIKPAPAPKPVIKPAPAPKPVIKPAPAPKPVIKPAPAPKPIPKPAPAPKPVIRLTVEPVRIPMTTMFPMPLSVKPSIGPSSKPVIKLTPAPVDTNVPMFTLKPFVFVDPNPLPGNEN
jgi:hypothetical protein